jgi:hypothetical protein
MKKVALSIFLLTIPINADAGLQILGGFEKLSTGQTPMIGLQVSWLKTADENWQFLSPGIVTGTTPDLYLSSQLFGRRIMKTDRRKWTNPPDLYLGLSYTVNAYNIKDNGIGVSLSFGW